MAVASTDYSSKAVQPYLYRFTCEHCGKDSGWQTAQELGIATLNVSGKRTLTEYEQMTLTAQAQSNLQNAIIIRKSKFKQGKYGESVKGKCPYCGKRQSWELASGKWRPWYNALQGLIAGLVILIIVGFFGKEAGNKAAITIPIGFFAGLIIGYIKLAKNKVDSMGTKARNKPEIVWPEQEGTSGVVTPPIA